MALFSLFHCVPLGGLCALSEPWFLHLSMGADWMSLRVMSLDGLASSTRCLNPRRDSEDPRKDN